jgi:hypothetical protein
MGKYTMGRWWVHPLDASRCPCIAPGPARVGPPGDGRLSSQSPGYSAASDELDFINRRVSLFIRIFIFSIIRGKKSGFVASLTEKPGFSPVEPQVIEKIPEFIDEWFRPESVAWLIS